MLSTQELLQETYGAFNARDIDAALTAMHPEVDWPNGMEGGRVHGHSQLRDYWTRQWQTLDPHVDPVRFNRDPDGRTAIDVHQVVRNMSGAVLVDQMVQHVYTVRDGLIVHMEIRGHHTLSQSAS